MTGLTGASAVHLENIRERYVVNMWKGVFAVVLVGTPVSLSRAFFTGWQPVYTVHLLIALCCVGVFVLLKKLTLGTKSVLLLALFWALGLPGIFTLGFPATSVWWLVLSCMVAGTVYSIRVGIALGVATLVVVAIAAFGFVSGKLTPAFDPNAYLHQPSAWATLVLVTGAFTFIVLRSAWLYDKSVVGLLKQVSDQRDQIKSLSMHDYLTGLPVAELAEDRVNMAILAAHRTGKKVALLFIDLDDFKAVNDTFGHEAGNAVLREVALRITAAIRAGDTVARLGGDELLAVIGGLADGLLAGAVSEKIIRAVAAPTLYKGNSITVGASIGIAMFPDDGDDSRELQNLADSAMYAAKKAGRNCYAYSRTPLAAPVVVQLAAPIATRAPCRESDSA